MLADDPRPLYLMGLAPALALLDEVGESSRSAIGRVAKGAPADLPPAEVLRELRPALEEGRIRRRPRWRPGWTTPAAPTPSPAGSSE